MKDFVHLIDVQVNRNVFALIVDINTHHLCQLLPIPTFNVCI